jgi:cytidylate kinase
MYRAVTRVAIDRGIDPESQEALAELAPGLEMRLIPREAGDRLIVDGVDITDQLRDTDVERGVSLVSRVSDVRSAMVRQQRAIAREGPIVMVGRDIGTVVLPQAEAKVFLEASVEVRARRRYLELKERGSAPDYREVVDDLGRRDKIDSERADSPLRPAGDAFRIDTDGMSIDEVVEKILEIVGTR